MGVVLIVRLLFLEIRKFHIPNSPPPSPPHQPGALYKVRCGKVANDEV